MIEVILLALAAYAIYRALYWRRMFGRALSGFERAVSRSDMYAQAYDKLYAQYLSEHSEEAASYDALQEIVDAAEEWKAKRH